MTSNNQTGLRNANAQLLLPRIHNPEERHDENHPTLRPRQAEQIQDIQSKPLNEQLKFYSKKAKEKEKDLEKIRKRKGIYRDPVYKAEQDNIHSAQLNWYKQKHREVYNMLKT